MADKESIRRFLDDAGNQRGIILFMSVAEREAWLIEMHAMLQLSNTSYSHNVYQFFGVRGSTLLVFVYTGEYEARRRLAGHRFDRFWNEGEMPRHVGELVLEKCR